MKLQEIKKFAREFPMPETLKLDVCTTIINLNMFFESHIIVMESTCNTKQIKMLHYNRVLKAIELLRKNKKGVVPIENPVTSITAPPPPVYERQNESKFTNNNDIDFGVLINKNNSALKPNNDFEINRKHEKSEDKQSNVDNSDSSSQMSLF